MATFTSRALHSSQGFLTAKRSVALASDQRVNAESGIRLRSDRPHALPAPVALFWTTFVFARHEPASVTQSTTFAPPSTVAQPRASTSMPPQPSMRTDGAVGMHRQRFYPSQWRNATQATLEAQARLHGHSIRWIGWDRSLPRLYLSIAKFDRIIGELVHSMARKASAIAPAAEKQESAAANVEKSNDASVIHFSIKCDTGSFRTVLLTLEHSELELSPGWSSLSLGAERSTAANRESSASYDLARIGRDIHDLGGSVVVRSRLGGGIVVRICLPADDRATLVRQWLEKARLQSTRSVGASPSIDDSMNVSLYVVGRAGRETTHELKAADARMQSLAGDGDFVYRLGHGKWLWLTINGNLPAFMRRVPWRSHQVANWIYPGGAIDPQRVQRDMVVEMIAAQMTHAIGRSVPTIDLLNQALVDMQPMMEPRKSSVAARSRQLRVDTSPHEPSRGMSIVPRRKTVEQAASASAATPPSIRRRWRYPI